MDGSQLQIIEGDMRPENWMKWDLDSRGGLEMGVYFADNGVTGYGFFLVLVELLYREDGHKLPYSDAAMQTYAKLCKIDVCIAKELLHQLCTLRLFLHDGEYFYSPRVLEEVGERAAKNSDISGKRREAANSRWNKEKAESQPSLPVSPPNANGCKPMQSDANDARGEKRRGDKNLNIIKSFREILPENLKGEVTIASIEGWLKYRAQINRPYKSEDSLKRLFRHWSRLGGKAMVTAIDTSIRNGWQGLFEPKNEYTGNFKPSLQSAPRRRIVEAPPIPKQPPTTEEQREEARRLMKAAGFATSEEKAR